MSGVATWNPWESWKPVTVKWIKVDISKEDLARFTRRSNLSGLCQSISFPAAFAITGFLAWLAFAEKHYVLFALVLLVHGTFYAFFGSALHELSHKHGLFQQVPEHSDDLSLWMALLAVQSIPLPAEPPLLSPPVYAASRQRRRRYAQLSASQRPADFWTCSSAFSTSRPWFKTSAAS